MVDNTKELANDATPIDDVSSIFTTMNDHNTIVVMFESNDVGISLGTGLLDEDVNPVLAIHDLADWDKADRVSEKIDTSTPELVMMFSTTQHIDALVQALMVLKASYQEDFDEFKQPK